MNNKIEKIKKLLSLAGNNPERDEAKSALEMAEKLMSLEGLSKEDISKSSMEDEFGELGENYINGGELKQIYIWKKQLLSSLAYLFDCSIINYSYGRKSKQLIVGRESNRVTCELMYNWIHDKTMKEAKKLYDSQTAKRNSYCVGVARGIAEKIYDIKPKSKATGKNCWGIVPINEVHEFIRKNHNGLKYASVSATVRDASALANGVKAGRDTSLNRQFGLKAIGA